MDIWALGGMFQYKLYKIICDIKGVKLYINDLLVLINDNFYKHIYQLIFVFGRLRAEGIKVDRPKCKFRLNYIPYLAFLITR